MPRTTRVLRCDLPIDVWDRLAAEAAAAGVPIGRYIRDLIVARDTRKHPGASPSTGFQKPSDTESESD